MLIPLTTPHPVKRRALFGLALLAGVLLPLALPNEIFRTGNPALGPVCIAPIFVAVSLASSFGEAALLGAVFGGVSTALADYWLMFFQNFSIWTYGGVIIGYIGYNALLFAFLRGFSTVARRYRPFVFAMAWALYEYLKSVGFLGYPWGLVAYPLSDFLPLVQFIDVTGIWGLSFLAALCNTLVAEWAMYAANLAPPIPAASRGGPSRIAWRSMLARDAAFVGILVTVVLGYGAVRLARPEPAGRTMNLLLVQQNIEKSGQLETHAAGLVRSNHRPSREEASKRFPDLREVVRQRLFAVRLHLVPSEHNGVNAAAVDIHPDVEYRVHL